MAPTVEGGTDKFRHQPRRTGVRVKLRFRASRASYRHRFTTAGVRSYPLPAGVREYAAEPA
ncbi:MAG: CRISPR-associated protein Cas5 [Nocardia sp.]|nr:CRISPR-associated protein Cas5 [Nocardia sp.]